MSLDVYENKMTLFYSKRSGDIQTFCSGIQDMNFFGENKEDYEIIWDFINVPLDEDIIKNTYKYKIEDGEIVLKPIQMNKYRIANR